MTETARQEEESIKNEARDGEVSEKSLRAAAVPDGKGRCEPFRRLSGANWMESEADRSKTRQCVVYFVCRKCQKGNSGLIATSKVRIHVIMRHVCAREL